MASLNQSESPLERIQRLQRERAVAERAEAQDRAVRVVKIVIGAVVAFFVLSTAMCSFKVIDPGERGVRVSLGVAEPKPLTPGWYWMSPFGTHIVPINVQTQRWSGTVQAQTNDTQTAAVDFVMNYNLRPDAASTIYQTVGEDWQQRLIGQVVYDQIRAVIGQHEAVKLAGEWNNASRDVEVRIREALAPKDVEVTGVQLTGVTYTPEFHKSIEQKVIAQQKAIEEQNRTVQIEQQAKQTVVKAQAEAESMRIRAQALESNKSLVQWEAVQHWNGVLPVYMMGNAVPFIQMPSEGK